MDERSKNFNSIRRNRRSGALSLSPSLPLPLLARVYCAQVDKRSQRERGREREIPSLPPSLPFPPEKLPRRDSIPGYAPPPSVLHLISLLLSSNYRNKIIISRRFLYPPRAPLLPPPLVLYIYIYLVERTPRSRIRADIGLHVLMTLEF